METREALFFMQALIKRYRDVNCDVYLCLIDYHRVQHHEMVGILKDLGLNEKDLQIIGNLYWNQIAFIKAKGECSEATSIERGVRQVYVLSPLLFNMYSEQIFRKALKEADEGLLLNGERLNNIRFAEDPAVMADNFKVTSWIS